MIDTREDIKNFTREKFLKRLYELSLKSIGEIPQVEEPDYYQKAWFVRKMKRTFT